MKKSLLSILSAATLITFPGCSTIHRTPEEKAQLIDDAAVILKSASRDAAALAIGANAKNADYIKLAVTVLDTFVVGSDYSPGALSKALSVVIKQTNDIKIQLAITTSLDLYELFYGRYAKGAIANTVAVKFITALRDGAQGALDLNPQIKPKRIATLSPVITLAGGERPSDPGTHIYGHRAEMSVFIRPN